ncbi:MAG: S8 family serine peptidase [Pseudomonadota bacterium]|nr:S8 family serine peptidase [Pseudomonadota bacterium]
MFVLLLATDAARAAELPEVGSADRVRVDIPDMPGAEATSDRGSVLLAPPAAGTKWRVEEAPSLDTYDATEGIEALGAEAWHAAGLTGEGVKVAVFDVQWFDAALWPDELGAYTTHDCQTHRSCDVAMDTFRPRYGFEEGSHGVACAQVIRDIAPGVELYLVRVNGQTTLENAAAWAVREGIDVVSMSMSFFNNSFHDGSGGVNDAVDILTAGGVLLVNSAGNYAEEHWVGEYDDADGDGDHDYSWGSSYMPVYYGAGTQSVQITWDQFGACGDTDLDVYAYDRAGNVVGRAEARQQADADNCSPVERLRLVADEADWYWIRVVLHAGDPSTRFSLFGRGGNLLRTEPGSVADPASHPSAFTVGAVRADGYLGNDVEAFSSQGPTHGGAAKPDIAGPDGLTTGVYGVRGFYGTSAATPAVAAAVALLLSEDPRLTPQEAADRLVANAISGRATWEAPDGALGAGYARLPAPGSAGDRGCPAPGGSGGAAAVFVPSLLWLSLLRRRRA